MPDRFVPADVTDFQAQGLVRAADGGVPEFFCFLPITDDEAVLVNFDFAVGMPGAFRGGAVHADVFDQLQTGVAYLDGGELLFSIGCEHIFVVEVQELLGNPVAGKAVNGGQPAAE